MNDEKNAEAVGLIIGGVLTGLVLLAVVSTVVAVVVKRRRYVFTISL